MTVVTRITEIVGFDTENLDGNLFSVRAMPGENSYWVATKSANMNIDQWQQIAQSVLAAMRTMEIRFEDMAGSICDD